MIVSSDFDFFGEMANELPHKRPPRNISDYVEGHRIMPANTPFPGYWENWRTHYAVEIMDSVSPFSPVQFVDVMAAAQVVKSAAVENILGYYMGAAPAPMLYVSGTDAMLSKWGPKRLEPLIDSLGLRDRMRAPVESKGSRSTGDKAKQKLFAGGFLEMSSAQSPSTLRADSIRVLFLEECDSAPRDLTTGEGRWDLVAEARTKTFNYRKKIIAVSTPTTYELSIIWQRYQDGDQREYFVPCPHCGKDQVIVRGEERGNHGLRAETKAGEVQLVYYLCEHCREAIYEHHKNVMIPNGRWVPGASLKRNRRSYHISSLYSPLGMYSWLDYWEDYQKAKNDPEGLRSFTNLQDGLPYREVGTRPKLENVVELRGGYRSGVVPDGVLYITVGMDVQRGYKGDKRRPARIEFEVLGIGPGYRTFSIMYKTIAGPIDDPYDGAWEELNEFAEGGGFVFKRRDGREFQPVMLLIDSGDGKYSDVVYRFCQRWERTYPSKGFSTLKKKHSAEPNDPITQGNFSRYRMKKIDSDTNLYEVGTNYYRTMVFNSLNIKRVDGKEQPAGFCDFPLDYGERYFRGLTAAEKRRDGSFVKKDGAEPFDCRVYAQCAADIWLDARVAAFKEAAKKDKRFNPQDIKKINRRFIIDKMREEIFIDKNSYRK